MTIQPTICFYMSQIIIIMDIMQPSPKIKNCDKHPAKIFYQNGKERKIKGAL